MPTKRANEPSKTSKQTKRRTEEGRIKRQGRSGGEENERQMANNVMRGIRVCDGYLICLDLCVDSPAMAPEIGKLTGDQILT